MDGLGLELIKILFWSLGLVIAYCVLIVLGLRYGWFLSLGKKLLARRDKKHDKESITQNAGEENKK